MRKAANTLITLVAAATCSQVSALALDGCGTVAPASNASARLSTRPNREFIPALPMPSHNQASSSIQRRFNAIQVKDRGLQTGISAGTSLVVLRGPIEQPDSSALRPMLIASSKTDSDKYQPQTTKRAKLMHFLHIPTL